MRVYPKPISACAEEECWPRRVVPTVPDNKGAAPLCHPLVPPPSTHQIDWSAMPEACLDEVVAINVYFRCKAGACLADPNARKEGRETVSNTGITNTLSGLVPGAWRRLRHAGRLGIANGGEGRGQLRRNLSGLGRRHRLGAPAAFPIPRPVAPPSPTRRALIAAVQTAPMRSAWL